MDPKAILNTTYALLESQIEQFNAALDGISDDDLNAWKPAAESGGGGPMNTLSALSVHVVAAARWRVEQQLFDREYVRDRDSEFTAKATREEILVQFAMLMDTFRELIDSGQDVDLGSLPTTIREDHPHWSRLDWLLSALSHTALHLGHAEIHRQLWLAERASTP